jgi:hypothetical protein
MGQKAIIDIDWLNSEIDKKVRALNSSLITEKGASFLLKVIPILRDIRSKCEPIEEPKPLPTTCTNEWESAKYCHNKNECQMCKEK